ncbi:molybdopterin-dependent oxidoreductase (plasmid) [Azospirillum oryzae]|uniref:Molybdopterin-dependent oxidoreductase n=1 Tax=Azospirillum oryzae TaxID=286727 RepID=A0A6N1AG09_9PROT|nr:molybdopterin cofactor-binding domain-containing protein [Azospirillum oryzae]KAA0587476.1 molybdopterin-dependent oxidoreductase [Azospirillum oryzae]QKS50466.1 molybdopterin-dependent oxidoreductase [Azospirillum oryzae]GLR78721.1 carbon monoxide dehydrogenase [Azospirillum oryzae]
MTATQTATQTIETKASPAPFVGRAMPRVEDAALLTGVARYADDLPVKPGTLHAAILRSPHAHADLLGIDTAAALAVPGVAAVVTGADAQRHASAFLVGVRAPMEHWCLAIDRVRHVGEPVAVVLADSRYLAEDALDRIEVRYRPLPPVTSIALALEEGSEPLHPAVGSNLVNSRRFRYGDPEAAFARAARTVSVEVEYPRNSCTPMECFVVLADYDAAEDSYEVLSNFSGPFAVHPVMARALKVPGSRLRLKTPPHSGGSFGNKQAVFPYVVLMGLCARVAGRPVKWVEDRLEHLMAATSATARRMRIDAAVEPDGRVLALRMEQTEDCGAYLRAPEPASLYRNHGNLTGAYDIPNLAVSNRIVVTNKTPTGLNRGFGGGQLYYGLERLMNRVAAELGLDPLDVIRRNLVAADAMPYRTASGGTLDSGDYRATLEQAVREGALDTLKARRDALRAEGRLYGIGYAAVVEPSISNMGYITTVLTAEERHKAGPKNGAQATASVAVDPTGGVSVTVASAPQGQGHRTVLAQVVADVFGLRFEDIRVNTDLDTGKDAWSIASGNYSSRFAGAVAGAAQVAATRLRGRMAALVAGPLNCRVEDVRFAGGKVFSDANPDNSLSFSRVAAAGHWAPGTLPDGQEAALRETAFWTPEPLKAPTDADHINSSACYGFIFDFCGVEIDRTTGALRIDRYVTMHDAGRLLNPLLVEGQILGGFAHAVGTALYEEYAYGDDGRFLSGTFADYLVPTACEVPVPVILHRESPSPVTPLGAKGVGEGNCMSTPVCLANAVADALSGIAVDEVPSLPITPAKLAALIHPPEPPRPASAAGSGETSPPAAVKGGRGLTGEGSREVPATPEQVWAILLDPKELAALLPGCEALDLVGPNAYRAEVVVGIGPVRGRYTAEVALSDLDPPNALTLTGSGSSALGTGRGTGHVRLERTAGGTRVTYRYSAEVGGKVAAVGGRMLDSASRLLIGQFFEKLVARAGGPAARPETPSLLARLLRLLGLNR